MKWQQRAHQITTTSSIKTNHISSSKNNRTCSSDARKHGQIRSAGARRLRLETLTIDRAGLSRPRPAWRRTRNAALPTIDKTHYSLIRLRLLRALLLLGAKAPSSSSVSPSSFAISHSQRQTVPTMGGGLRRYPSLQYRPPPPPLFCPMPRFPD